MRHQSSDTRRGQAEVESSSSSRHRQLNAVPELTRNLHPPTALLLSLGGVGKQLIHRGWNTHSALTEVAAVDTEGDVIVIL